MFVLTKYFKLSNSLHFKNKREGQIEVDYLFEYYLLKICLCVYNLFKLLVYVSKHFSF